MEIYTLSRLLIDKSHSQKLLYFAFLKQKCR